VKNVQFIAPDGTTPIPFDWSTPMVPGDDGVYSGTNATTLDTGAAKPGGGAWHQPIGNSTSTARFNDRLITVKLHFGEIDYANIVKNAGGDNYIRLRYTPDSAPTDRTTIGVVAPGGTTTLPRLQRVK
jgi:hypothetical protein